MQYGPNLQPKPTTMEGFVVEPKTNVTEARTRNNLPGLDPDMVKPSLEAGGHYLLMADSIDQANPDNSPHFKPSQRPE